MSAVRDALRPQALPALLLLLLLALLWGHLVPRATGAAASPPGFDTLDFHNYFLPRYVFGTQELLAGQLPVWSRLEYAGIPFLATMQTAALYPPKLLAFALLEPEPAMIAYLVAHQLLLAGGFLLFMRSRGIVGLGALAGALFLAFNGMVLISAHHPSRIANLAWIPLIFWLADRAARSSGRAGLAALAVAVALQLLAGYVEFTLHTALLLGVASLALWATGSWTRAPWRTLSRLALGFALGAAIAGLQLVPFAELLAESQRALYAQAFVAGSAAEPSPPLRGIEVLKNSLLFMPGLAVFWLAAPTRRAGIPPLVVFLFASLMGTVGWQWLRELPLFSGLRHGLAWLVTGQFASAWLVAIGADAFARAGGRSARERGVAWLVGLLALLWFALCGVALFAAPAAAPGAGVASAFGEIAAAIRGGATARAFGAAGALLLVSAALAAGPTRVGLGYAAVMGLALGHVAAYPLGVGVGPFRPPNVDDRLARLYPPALTGATGRTLSNADVTWGYTFYDRIPSLFGVEKSVPPARVRELEERLDFDANWHTLDWKTFAAAEGFLDALDVELVVAPELQLPAFPASRWQAVGRRLPQAVVLRNLERPGRAWVSYGARVVPSQQAALDRLLDPEFDPRHEVILEHAGARAYPERADQPPTPARARFPSATVVEVEAELPRPGILVLSESFFPGWRVEVDGAPAPLLRGDYLLRAVELEPGPHRVRFEYRPWSVRIGAALSLAGLVVLGGLVWSDRRGRGGSAREGTA